MIEFYLVALLIGLVVSIEDFRNGLIKNKYIILLVLFGLISKIFYSVEPVQFAFTLCYGFAVSVFFWVFGIWPAGDSKFFWALLFFLPAQLYGSTDIVWGFLINSFVPIFILMLFFIAHKSKLNIVLESLKEAFDPYVVFMILLMITGFLWFFQRAMSLLGLKADFLVLFIVLFVIFELFRRYCTFKNELLFAGLAVLRVMLDYQTVYSLNFFFDLAKFLLVFVFFRYFIVRLAFKVFTREVPISELEEGMSPAEGVFKKKEEYKKESLISMSFIGFMMQKKKKYTHGIEYLSRGDVQKLKKLEKDKKLGFDSILVHQNQPFAVFLLTGFIITVLCSGSFFKLFKLLS